ncbi:MAG TPA: hypothetical protein VGF26_25280, partial [Ramlibacter sp.]
MDNRTTTAAKKKSTKTTNGAASIPKANGLQPIQTRDGAEAEAQSRQILAALMAFAGGEFGTRLPVTWGGTDGRIAEAFNLCIGNAQRITSEAARLSNTVGKEGRLTQRIATPGAVGGWADQVNSLNTLIDDLVRPTTDIARTIGAVAKGDLGQSMELQVDGR